MLQTNRAKGTAVTNPELTQKLEALSTALAHMERVAVAFSAGVDSTFLLAVAHEVLGDFAIALHATSAFSSTDDDNEARAFCVELGIELVEIPMDVLEYPDIVANTPQRCFFCKRRIFSEMIAAARARGFSYVVDGSNLDDRGDYRPGMRALEELEVKSPLLEAGFTKADIRALSHEIGLRTWNKPSAACLASRVAYGEALTAEKLECIGMAERFVRGLGFEQCRVRTHGDVARIEVPAADIARLAGDDLRGAVSHELKRLGFKYVALDLVGYRMGSMNETLA